MIRWLVLLHLPRLCPKFFHILHQELLNEQCHIMLYITRHDLKALKLLLSRFPTLTMDQMTVCDVKQVVHTDNPTENHPPTLQFGFTALGFTVWFSPESEYRTYICQVPRNISVSTECVNKQHSN